MVINNDTGADPAGAQPPRRAVPTEESLRLVNYYKRWFDIVVADTPELIRESHKLRYQVYCVETGFEDAGEFPDGLEVDQYDERSLCSLLIHKPSGLVAGTVRLILPHAEDPVANPLPAFTVSDDLANFDDSLLPRATTAEISRFAISKEFRKRREDSILPALYDRAGMEGEKRVIPHITLGLMQAVLRMSLEIRLTHAAIVIEPALDRLLRKLGIFFAPVGPLIEYHGKRRAHYRNNAELLDEIYYMRPEIWEVLTNKGTLWRAPEENE